MIANKKNTLARIIADVCVRILRMYILQWHFEWPSRLVRVYKHVIISACKLIHSHRIGWFAKSMFEPMNNHESTLLWAITWLWLLDKCFFCITQASCHYRIARMPNVLLQNRLDIQCMALKLTRWRMQIKRAAENMSIYSYFTHLFGVNSLKSWRLHEQITCFEPYSDVGNKFFYHKFWIGPKIGLCFKWYFHHFWWTMIDYYFFFFRKRRLLKVVVHFVLKSI